MKLPQMAIIKFLDHCKYSGKVDDVKPLQCELVGVIYKQDKLCYYVATWLADGVVDDNTEHYVILKSVVTKLIPIKRGKK